MTRFDYTMLGMWSALVGVVTMPDPAASPVLWALTFICFFIFGYCAIAAIRTKP